MYVPLRTIIIENSCKEELEAILFHNADSVVPSDHPQVKRVEGIVNRIANVAYNAGNLSLFPLNSLLANIGDACAPQRQTPCDY